MPELPEVEVVRRGLDDHVVGRTITSVEVLDSRSVRRHGAGPTDFVARLVSRRVDAAHRRGKYLWLSLDDGSSVLMHLGMSGQALISDADAPATRHLRIVLDLDDGRQLRFADQRIFGGMSISETDPPTEIAHIALDPLDPAFDDADFVARLRRRQTGVKRALLDQGLVSGVGNIYADEALWRTPLHYARNTKGLRIAEATALIGHVRDVMTEALAQGGTSFDALYVNVNGQSGYFDRSLHAYGQEGRPCERCGAMIVREPFMNRSSYRCPTCQPRPRNGRW
ncbi:bifunctional DNA-formamidopyrimidine glycosylase/DNA-(apurinic or apyrimidinic site) lyase [Aeromicrobium duanguangcaii]|uniref:Formamidopyrimidine-DNA glycosylase n=1 Tax=Aeromicrobium duanguangcaii TaxID=2968086 RepID=A0ABY5KGS6_9ACTN|nr:bifunctional DNA-formamidopyrimidine glycosylase/DNA-(apurinic or apyrimidinic site) lyase [Aeromicrobium duanguangcaii]MCD9153399.1 bifunctional DNA-formamidopyrimidine glycosylase/DNA-(apurinic or apyrimidinic site) lyase [Aeromicrobium duanguangcaii]MCL3836615.1 bifunctional DNA-formamidopyrimidine glycosylase/DNA-(apurinic or apyrimidinic site) lyase [Aeromicrobium duanguangcaii]UUI69509.1 bifunctional DNA-formamidopyrimidine glycosylase/DNA-(apurinic or apyrimidinic site) lyase [Aeromicr